ncbi:MAG TPA: ABC transporter ATP-binding protein [Corynebacteriales bacterium]|nr:ABC transporter ATP-binding protein [Mycobacteriales bacterium]
MASVTKISGVSYRYPTSNPDSPSPIEDLNLQIQPGESVLICGGSGSGKSSVIRLLNGLIPNYHEGELTGTVTHGDHVINEEPLYNTGSFTATVFQNPRTQFFTTDVTSELAFGCENFGMDPEEIRARIVQVADELALWNLLGKNLFRISGGEKQRVACGCSIMAQPDLYLFDEPTSNLSPKAIAGFRDIYKRLRDQGATLVVAEHRLYFLRDLVDRVIIMEQGKIKAELTGEEFWKLSPAERRHFGLRDLQAPHKPELPTIRVNRKQGEDDTAADDIFHIIDSGALRRSDFDAGLSIRDLTFSYGDKKVLDIPYLDLPAGKVTCVAGPNGAGKSTFANVLTGLAKAKGSFTFRDQKMGAKARLRKSYMVMQDVHRQLFGTSVTDELTLDSRHKKTNPEEIEQLLYEFDLTEVADRHPLSLSGGQKQRVVIATAKACGKDIIVFDEPSSGLDYSHMQAIARAIRELADQNKVVVVITHDYELMNLCGDLLLHIDKRVAS